MKRLLSVKLKLKRNTTHIVNKTGINNINIGGAHDESGKQSISTLLALAVDPKRTGPTSQELHRIAQYSKRGELECLKLKGLILEYLTLSEELHNYIEILKILTVLDYVLVCGSVEFYYIFVNGEGQGVLKLKVLYEMVTGREVVIERIMSRVTELLWLCKDQQHWEDRRWEYASIRAEIHMPTSRRSFESSSAVPGVNSVTSVSHGGVKRAQTVSYTPREPRGQQRPLRTRSLVQRQLARIEE